VRPEIQAHLETVVVLGDRRRNHPDRRRCRDLGDDANGGRNRLAIAGRIADGGVTDRRFTGSRDGTGAER
jgi:hypothetical protein